MNKDTFLKLKEQAEQFKYTSMNYTDFEEVEQYEQRIHNDKLILLYGYNKERGYQEYHWACNNKEDLLAAIGTNHRDTLVSFVPAEWVEAFKSFGFRLYAVFHSYFNPDIRNIADAGIPELLTDEDCVAASQVTLSCYEQSRGFHGETPEWMYSWIHNEEPAAAESGAINCAVILHREDKEIVGLVCTAVYGFDSEKGPVSWIREVAVSPEFQNRGIAGKLILQAMNYGKRLGAVRAFLMADECNEPAIHLYEKLGFIAKKEDGQIDMLLNN